MGAALNDLRENPAIQRTSPSWKIARSKNPCQILDILADHIAMFGASWIMLGHIVNVDRFRDARPLKMTNVRLRFLDELMPHQAIIHDPVLHEAWQRSDPFFWHEVIHNASPEGLEFLRKARSNGLKAGLTFPMVFAGRPLGAVSIAGERLSISQQQVAALNAVLTVGYRRLEDLCGPYNLEPRVQLSVLETEVLHFAASGKSSWETATILGKTETSVSAAIKRAVRKLNAANRTEAVAKALAQRLIL
ncbi:MAG: autoinducer binding domain-containing protein [Pseudomonadota bacterium]